MTTREVKLGVGIFLGSLSVLLFRFFIPRPVGMADNGDGYRILCRLGVNQTGAPWETFVQFRYPAGTDCFSYYITSQKWLDKAAQLLGHLLGSTAALDLRILGAVCCVLTATAITAIVLGLKLSQRGNIIATAALLLVAADSAFFGYFASVLSEGAAFLGLLLLTGGLLLMARADRWRYFGAVITVIGAVIGINAKAQTLLLLPFLALALIFIRRRQTRGLQRWIVPLAVLTATLAGTAFIQSQGPSLNSEYRVANAYNTIFNSILDEKHDSGIDLAELGLPPEFAKYQNTSFWDPQAAVDDPQFARYQNNISQRNLLHFYAAHPDRMVGILQKASQDALKARPDNLGSFGKDSGQEPFAKEYRVPVLSALTSILAPLGLFFLVPLWLLIGWLGIRSLKEERRSRDVGVIILMLTFFAITQFSISGLADGVEGTKHQLLTLFPTLLAAVLAALSFLKPRDATTPESSSSQQAPIRRVADKTALTDSPEQR